MIDAQGTEAKVAARVESRKLAGLLLEMAYQESFNNADATMTFWSVIRDAALKHAPLPISEPRPSRIQAMTKPQAMHFERSPIPWGKYAGYTVGEIVESDPDYLDWLAGQGEETFKTQLNRYLMAGPDVR